VATAEPDDDDLLAGLEDELRDDAAARLRWALDNLRPGDPAITRALLFSALVS
jgi:hypothetical protein